MHLLGCLIFFIFGALFVVLSLIGAAGEALRRMLFGPRPGNRPDAGGHAHRQAPGQPPRDEKSRKAGKIFKQGDGEYVDFEEIR